MASDSSDPTAEAQIDDPTVDTGERIGNRIDELIDATTAALESAGAADEAIEAVETAGEAVVETVEEATLDGEDLDGRDDADAGADLRERVDELEDDLEKTHDVAKTAVGTAQHNETRIDDLEERDEKTREIARCAIAKAQQVDRDVDDDAQEDAEALPGGVDPSSSPLDFFANCRQQTVKEIFIEQSNRSNTYRAIAIAKRWQEFATKRNDGSSIFWSRDDVESALTAHLGEAPHRQTVTRVRDKLHELGGSDVEKRRHQVGRRQEPKQVVEMDIETARGLQESRYLGLDLLDGTDRKATSGGVTPVVTGGTGQAP